MKRSWLSMVFLILALCLLCPLPVSADMGPKPSVNVTFENLGEETCYATLLSKTDSTGPYSAWNGREENLYHEEHGIDRTVWEAFIHYEDEDGFYFLQIAWQVNERKALSWSYYPPEVFKILLYYPENETFAVSDVCYHEAFDTYYTVTMQGNAIGDAAYDESQSGNHRLTVYRAKEIGRELGMLGARFLLTVIIELALALLFGFREKRQLLLLLALNAATQVGLNLLLWLGSGINRSYSFFLLLTVVLELFVFLTEAVVCVRYLPRAADKPRPVWLTVVYVFAANLASFMLGLWLSNLLPELF
ncbi:MAG: hypothetical protein E7618_05860 [Ruminococcaceae bacterium]|nr:hypothetical protein [Oscillospiraceae bacterium]